MKNIRISYKIFLLLTVLIFSCNSEESKNKSKEPFQLLLETDNTENIIRSTIEMLNASKLNPDSLIAPENENPIGYPPVVKFIKQSSDTIYLQILNEFYLTQSMGSTGAINYIDSVSAPFIKIKGINYVNLSFSPGDHAEPGVYSKSGYNIVSD